MSLSTLVISEVQGMTEQIENLIGESKDLNVVAVSPRETAQDNLKSSGARVVWIALSPDPEAGLSLLSTLRDNFEDVHFLVSNETLEADLVKRSMQIGAVDFLDSKTWDVQLPDVTSRVIAKELTVQREVRRKEKIQEMLESQKNPKSSNPALKSMRQKTSEMEDMSGGATIAGVLIIALLGAIIYMFFM